MSRVTVPDASQDVADKDISRLCPPKIKPPPAHLPTLDLAFSNTAHAGTESCGHTSRWPRPPCSSVVSVPPTVNRLLVGLDEHILDNAKTIA